MLLNSKKFAGLASLSMSRSFVAGGLVIWAIASQAGPVGAAPVDNTPLSPNEEKLIRLKRDADTAYSANNYGVAEKLYLQTLKQAESLGKPDKRLADTLASLADLYSTRGQFSKAEPYYERELRVREKVLGSEHPQVVASVGRLSQFNFAHGSSQKAERLANLILSFAERKGKDQQAAKDNMVKLDRFYDKSKDYLQAHVILQKLQEETQRTTSTENLELATTLDSLGHLYQDRGRFDIAERMYKKALAFRESVLSANHMALASSFENLANLYSAQKKSDQAKPYLKQALDITEKTLQPGKKESYKRLDELAQSYLTSGQTSEAESLYKRALTVMDKTPNGGDVGQASLALGTLYAKKGQYLQAEPLIKRSLQIAESINGPRHQALVPILNSYADVLANLNKTAESNKYRSRARAIAGMTLVKKPEADSDF